jgi:L-idonate 5-dehydrogenase
VEIAIEAGGICGSDLHYYNHGGFGTVRVREPMILGHEVAGTIKALGQGVSHLAIGDRVAVSPSRPCNACEYCLQGNRTTASTCGSMAAMPMPHIQGAFRQRLVAEAWQCHKVARWCVDQRGRDCRTLCRDPPCGQSRRLVAGQARARDGLRSDRRAGDHRRTRPWRARGRCDRRDGCRLDKALEIGADRSSTSPSHPEQLSAYSLPTRDTSTSSSRPRAMNGQFAPASRCFGLAPPLCSSVSAVMSRSRKTWWSPRKSR